MSEETVKSQVEQLMGVLQAQQEEAMSALYDLLTGEAGQSIVDALDDAKTKTLPGSAYEKACQNMSNALKATIALAQQGARRAVAP